MLPGLINNVLYVIILSAALDLVGPRVPKGIVLLADVLPSFFVKLTAPYYIHNISYPTRILTFVALSMGGMVLIALTPDGKDGANISAKLAGIALASLSSGGGELSFLGLTHYYGPFSLAAWGSGTGGAGLVGAGAYVAATTWIGWSVRSSLLGFSLLPFVMLLGFFFILPLEPLRRARSRARNGYEQVPSSQEEENGLLQTSEAMSSEGVPDDASPAKRNPSTEPIARALYSFKSNLKRAQHLFFP